jgi:hypothetical protein
MQMIAGLQRKLEYIEQATGVSAPEDNTAADIDWNKLLAISSEMYMKTQNAAMEKRLEEI